MKQKNEFKFYNNLPVLMKVSEVTEWRFQYFETVHKEFTITNLFCSFSIIFFTETQFCVLILFVVKRPMCIHPRKTDSVFEVCWRVL